MAEAKDVEAVMKAATKLSFEEWLKVSKAITRTFAEQEHRARQTPKLSDTERIKYFLRDF